MFSLIICLLSYLSSVLGYQVPLSLTADQQTFQILHISAHSDHPVRNSAGEFIFGNHILWEHNNTHSDDEGSFAPNVFAYDFTSPLAWSSLLDVTIKVTNFDLFGTSYRLCGMLGGSKVYESDVFTITPAKEATVAAYVIQPHSSPGPFTFNGDFIWMMEQRQAERSLRSSDETRLELYWISADIHEIFLTGLSGIPIDFLRSVVLVKNPHSKFAPLQGSGDWSQVTRQAFSSYSKVYDTVIGKARFGVDQRGGLFDYNHYIQRRWPSTPPGSLQPIVNCMDQAAMVQVSGSFAGYRPTWLLHQPNGFIKPTFLVGIRWTCNNPFFRGTIPPAPPLVEANDKRRQPFGIHVFNGFFEKFSPNHPQERIFDATGGPHAGTETPAQYLRATIDTTTILYRERGWRFGPGTVANITQQAGVTSKLMAYPRSDYSALGANMENFVRRCRVNNAKTYSQGHWDDVGTWAKIAFGNGCEVAYQSANIGEGVVERLWHLTGVEGVGSVPGVDGVEGDVVVRVRAETHVDEHGKLDFGRSFEAARDDFVFLLKDHQVDLGPDDENLESLWAPAPFGDCAQYAVQYAAHIAAGRILLVSGNLMIDISGGSSSAALVPVARKLLAHTTVNNPFSLHVPAVTWSAYNIPVFNRGLFDDTVNGVGSSFDYKCQMNGLIAAASADAEDYGVLLNKYRIVPNHGDATSTVIFTFVAREVGTHLVNLRFQQAQTMSASVKRIRVTVTGT